MLRRRSDECLVKAEGDLERTGKNGPWCGRDTIPQVLEFRTICCTGVPHRQLVQRQLNDKSKFWVESRLQRRLEPGLKCRNFWKAKSGDVH